MKKIILIFMLAPIFVLSQDSETFKRNEIKLNAGYLLAGYPEISYERLLNDETSIGLSAGASIDKDINFNFSVIPHFRVYFGKKPGAGFFMEGNLGFYSQKGTNYYQSQTYPYFVQYEEATIFGFGAGIGFGGKFISKSGFIAELLAGVGRNFINNDQLEDAYPRFGISIGKRF
ncbi:MAG: hypothetical protein ABIT08_12560 [Bacteroidia bacterium]